MKKENTYKKIFIKLTNSNKKKRMGIILNWNFCLHLGIGICIFYGFKPGMCATMAAFGAMAILVGEHIKE